MPSPSMSPIVASWRRCTSGLVRPWAGPRFLKRVPRDIEKREIAVLWVLIYVPREYAHNHLLRRGFVEADVREEQQLCCWDAPNPSRLNYGVKGAPALQRVGVFVDVY